MILKYILLALSASIDALSLGITYGIKCTKMSKASNVIIFVVVLVCSTFALLLGHYISLLFSPTISILLGSSLLILLGMYNIFKGINKVNNVKDFDIDNSNYIDNKEALALALAVAVDASCVSMSCGFIGYGSFILPIFMAIFHTFFVNCGNFVAKSVVQKINIPANILTIIAGILLVLIGSLRVVF